MRIYSNRKVYVTCKLMFVTRLASVWNDSARDVQTASFLDSGKKLSSFSYPDVFAKTLQIRVAFKMLKSR